MIDEQFPQEPVQETSKPNWKIWIAAGGCAVFLCAAIFVGDLDLCWTEIRPAVYSRKDPSCGGTSA